MNSNDLINDFFSKLYSGNINEFNKFIENNNLSINITNKNNENALHVIIKSDLSDILKINFIKYLNSKNINVNAKDCLGNTPFNLACQKQLFNIMTILYNTYNIDLYDKNNFNLSPIYFILKGMIIDDIENYSDTKEFIKNNLDEENIDSSDLFKSVKNYVLEQSLFTKCKNLITVFKTNIKFDLLINQSLVDEKINDLKKKIIENKNNTSSDLKYEFYNEIFNIIKKNHPKTFIQINFESTKALDDTGFYLKNEGSNTEYKINGEPTFIQNFEKEKEKKINKIEKYQNNFNQMITSLNPKNFYFQFFENIAHMYYCKQFSKNINKLFNKNNNKCNEDVDYVTNTPNLNEFIKHINSKNKKKDKIIKVASGKNHFLYLTSDGFVFAYGRNDKKQCGINSPNFINPPKKIRYNFGKVVDISCGSEHSLVLNNKGKVFGFGIKTNNESGGSGLINEINIEDNIISIACGGNHNLLLTENKTVMTFGKNNRGQLGRDGDSKKPTELININFIEKIACGDNHSIIVDTNGVVKSFGDNSFGQLGTNRHIDLIGEQVIQIVAFGARVEGFETNRNIIQKIKGTGSELHYGKIIDVACGKNHTLILNDKKEVYSFGDNSHGQLGFTFNLDNNFIPRRNYVVNFGTYNFMNQTIDSKLKEYISDKSTTRPNFYVNTIVGNTTYIEQPLPITGTLEEYSNNENFGTIMSISCGEDHSIIVNDLGMVFTFGKYDNTKNKNINKLGHSEINTDLFLPKYVKGTGNSKYGRIISSSAGSEHTLILNNTGYLYSFGGYLDSFSFGGNLIGNLSNITFAFLLPFIKYDKKENVNLNEDYFEVTDLDKTYNNNEYKNLIKFKNAFFKNENYILYGEIEIKEKTFGGYNLEFKEGVKINYQTDESTIKWKYEGPFENNEPKGQGKLTVYKNDDTFYFSIEREFNKNVDKFINIPKTEDLKNLKFTGYKDDKYYENGEIVDNLIEREMLIIPDFNNKKNKEYIIQKNTLFKNFKINVENLPDICVKSRFIYIKNLLNDRELFILNNYEDDKIVYKRSENDREIEKSKLKLEIEVNNNNLTITFNDTSLSIGQYEIKFYNTNYDDILYIPIKTNEIDETIDMFYQKRLRAIYDNKYSREIKSNDISDYINNYNEDINLINEKFNDLNFEINETYFDKSKFNINYLNELKKINDNYKINLVNTVNEYKSLNLENMNLILLNNFDQNVNCDDTVNDSIALNEDYINFISNTELFKLLKTNNIKQITDLKYSDNNNLLSSAYEDFYFYFRYYILENLYNEIDLSAIENELDKIFNFYELEDNDEIRATKFSIIFDILDNLLINKIRNIFFDEINNFIKDKKLFKTIQETDQQIVDFFDNDLINFKSEFDLDLSKMNDKIKNLLDEKYNKDNFIQNRIEYNLGNILVNNTKVEPILYYTNNFFDININKQQFILYNCDLKNRLIKDRKINLNYDLIKSLIENQNLKLLKQLENKININQDSFNKLINYIKVNKINSNKYKYEDFSNNYNYYLEEELKKIQINQNIFKYYDYLVYVFIYYYNNNEEIDNNDHLNDDFEESYFTEEDEIKFLKVIEDNNKKIDFYIKKIEKLKSINSNKKMFEIENRKKRKIIIGEQNDEKGIFIKENDDYKLVLGIKSNMKGNFKEKDKFLGKINYIDNTRIGEFEFDTDKNEFVLIKGKIIDNNGISTFIKNKRDNNELLSNQEIKNYSKTNIIKNIKNKLINQEVNIEDNKVLNMITETNNLENNKNIQLNNEYKAICLSISLVVGNMYSKLLKRFLLEYLMNKYPKEINDENLIKIKEIIKNIMIKVDELINKNDTEFTNKIVIFHSNERYYNSKYKDINQDSLFDEIINIIKLNPYEKIDEDDIVLTYLKENINDYFKKYYEIAVKTLIACSSGLNNYILYHNKYNKMKLFLEGIKIKINNKKTLDNLNRKFKTNKKKTTIDKFLNSFKKSTL